MLPLTLYLGNFQGHVTLPAQLHTGNNREHGCQWHDMTVKDKTTTIYRHWVQTTHKQETTNHWAGKEEEMNFCVEFCFLSIRKSPSSLIVTLEYDVLKCFPHSHLYHTYHWHLVSTSREENRLDGARETAQRTRLWISNTYIKSQAWPRGHMEPQCCGRGMETGGSLGLVSIHIVQLVLACNASCREFDTFF